MWQGLILAQMEPHKREGAAAHPGGRSGPTGTDNGEHNSTGTTRSIPKELPDVTVLSRVFKSQVTYHKHLKTSAGTPCRQAALQLLLVNTTGILTLKNNLVLQ